MRGVLAGGLGRIGDLGLVAPLLAVALGWLVPPLAELGYAILVPLRDSDVRDDGGHGGAGLAALARGMAGVGGVLGPELLLVCATLIFDEPETEPTGVALIYAPSPRAGLRPLGTPFFHGLNWMRGGSPAGGCLRRRRVRDELERCGAAARPVTCEDGAARWRSVRGKWLRLFSPRSDRT